MSAQSDAQVLQLACTYLTVPPSVHSVIRRKRQRSSTQSSEDFDVPQQPNVKKQLHTFLELKMDLLEKDISDLRSESDPSDIIKLLYGNCLTVIRKLLKPHFTEVKIEAEKHCEMGLHQEVVAEGAIGSAESVSGLFSQMSVNKMWSKTRFLRKAVGAIPRSAPECQVAEAILSHYNMHLAIYEQASLLKNNLAKHEESKKELEGQAPGQKTNLVPLEITSLKAFDSFACEDCHLLQARVLSTAFGIPEAKIICHNAAERHSTTVTFLIPSHYTPDVVQRTTLLSTVWILLELKIIEVSIPRVFTFTPSVNCFLTLLRGTKYFTADLLGVTEVRVLQCVFYHPQTYLLNVYCNHLHALAVNVYMLLFLSVRVETL